MNFNKLNIITGWIIWAIATVVYILTLEPTMPFWDCGEFIASAHKLEVGHPPGAPLFMLISRLFSAVASSPSQVPYMINMLSGLASSFTILFLFWTITHFAKKIADLSGGINTTGRLYAIIGSGVVGALAFTFSDTFWFSAVEGEVYAMSSLLIAVVFWAILKWESVVDETGELRWIILIAYLVGLSIGVHLLNLLAIPAICYVYYFKKYEFSIKGLIVTGITSLILLGLVQKGIIIYLVKLAGLFERVAINNLGLPFNSGVLIYVILFISLISFGLWFTAKKGKVMWNTLILGIAVASIGYTSFATIIIRSQANPPMDENNPENLFALLSYLNREQYGDRPFLQGQYFNTPQDMTTPYKDGADVWVKSYSVRSDDTKDKLILSCRTPFEAEAYIQQNADKKLKLVEQYVESGEKKGSIPNYDQRFCGYFPRMHSSQANHLLPYKEWSDYKEWSTPRGKEKVKSMEESIEENEAVLNYYSQKNAMPRGYEDKTPGQILKQLEQLYAKAVPSAGEEMRFFTNYQLGWMYWRYFMWNFTGRQNDKQGNGEFTDGNWVSGVKMIDEKRLGSRESLPQAELTNKGFNTYFFLPLILGLIGLVFQLLVHKKDFSVVGMLFILTGVAVVIYLNQPPTEPRERDYTSVGSFYAFAIWIGLSVYALYYAATNMTVKNLGTLAAMTIGGSIIIFAVEAAAGGGSALGLSLLFISVITVIAFGIMVGLNMTSKGDGAMKGIVPTLLALVAPFLLCSYNWDDHSRAKRETGLAMAVNYLESLAPNAIIFTNGDNDTFPLWYAQEVEGIRTDVRIVNLSLLNTDWYIDQMKRQAYLSAPVPIKMPEQKYRQGTRDVMFMDPYKETKGFMPLNEAMQIALDDSKFVVNGKSKINYLPTYKFSMKVDPAVAESYRQYMHEGDSLVNEITWSTADGNGRPRSFITKANLAVLDILNNMDWNRPVYFAVTTGGDAYMGLENYFQLEGLAYRLTPILHKKSENPNLDGGIGTDLMYKNMMEKFQWGNMDTEDIYMDENNRRMTTNLRLQFGHLAQQLIDENKLDSARTALNKALDVMPEKTVPYEQPQIMWQFVDLLYQAGDSTKALDLSKRLIDLNNQEVAYYHSLDPQRQQVITRDITMRVQISDRLALMAKNYKPNDPDVQAMNTTVAEQRTEFELPSYEEYLLQEKQMNQMRKTQDSIMSLRPKATTPIVVDGPNGIQKK
jgi:tetratricopeptide (TPR) repeat protein